MKGCLLLAALATTCATVAGNSLAHFNIVMVGSDPSINGSAVVDTNNNEIDIEGVLQPSYGSGDPTVFYLDSATGYLATNSTLTNSQRFAYTLYSNFTSSIRFDNADRIDGDVACPKFTIADNGSLTAENNATLAWCPDEFDVGDGWYLPGSITLGSIAKGCTALDRLVAVPASS